MGKFQPNVKVPSQRETARPNVSFLVLKCKPHLSMRNVHNKLHCSYILAAFSTYKTPLGLIKLLHFEIGLAVSRWVGQFHVGLALSRWVGTFPLGGTCEHNAVLCEQQQPERIIAESCNSLQFHKR